MAQFSVPQFTDVEDKIIGSLTLKQFFILLGGGLLIVLVYRAVGSLPLFFLFALPIGGGAAIIAFGTYNGKSVVSILMYGVNFVAQPRSYIFHRQVEILTRSKKSAPAPQMTGKLTSEERLSRLHKLTYILDQEHKAEEELIGDDYPHLKQ